MIAFATVTVGMVVATVAVLAMTVMTTTVAMSGDDFIVNKASYWQ